jgi:hypothetical protein
MFNVLSNRELLIARLKREARYLLSDLVPPLRRPIQPFVVVCTLRTGSNMLRYALETHPQVVHYGEIFRDTIDRIPGAHGKYAYRPHMLIAWRRRDARSFLDEVIYRDVSPPIRAVGFKLFYWHGREAGAGNPWPVLRERTDIKVIHLTRQNPVAAFVSAERALTASYVEMRGNSAGNGRATPTRQDAGKPIFVDVAKFRDFLVKYDGYVQRVDDELGNRPIMNLPFEALTADTAGSIDRVLALLGAEPRALRVQTEKQSSGNVVKRIENLAEVAAAHRGTRWAHVPDAW